jgi:hypothetical protein
VKRLVSCACESQTKGQTVEISNVCGTPMCPNSIRTVTGIADPTKPPITTDSFVHTESPSEHSYPPITCNCDVPTIPELGACSRKTKAGTPNPGANPMAWGGAHDITFCGCESGSRSHAGTTVCDQFVCPNDPELETPTPCPLGACAWPTNEKLGKCSSTTAVLSTDGGPARTFGYCECQHQGVEPVPMLTGCDGSHGCPNQADLVTADRDGAYNGASDTSCTLGLPSMSFWDSCVYTRDLPFGWEIKEEDNIRHYCLCNVADNRGVTNTYAPVTVNCGNFLCHNSAPIRLGRRDVASHGQMEAPILSSPSVVTAVTPLVSVTTGATPGSLPTANAGPTSVPMSG